MTEAPKSIALFENELLIIDTIRTLLADTAYQVEENTIAQTRDEAVRLIRKMASGLIVVHAVLIDGNLEPGADGEEKGEDAKAIIEALKENAISAPRIGISKLKMSDHGIYVGRDEAFPQGILNVHYDLTKLQLYKLEQVLNDEPWNAPTRGQQAPDA